MPNSRCHPAAGSCSCGCPIPVGHLPSGSPQSLPLPVAWHLPFPHFVTHLWESESVTPCLESQHVSVPGDGGRAEN